MPLPPAASSLFQSYWSRPPFPTPLQTCCVQSLFHPVLHTFLAQPRQQCFFSRSFRFIFSKNRCSFFLIFISVCPVQTVILQISSSCLLSCEIKALFNPVNSCITALSLSARLIIATSPSSDDDKMLSMISSLYTSVGCFCLVKLWAGPVFLSPLL